MGLTPSDPGSHPRHRKCRSSSNPPSLDPFAQTCHTGIKIGLRCVEILEPHNKQVLSVISARSSSLQAVFGLSVLPGHASLDRLSH